MSSVCIPLASSMLDYPFQRQTDEQDWFPGSMPHAHIATVGIDRLCLNQSHATIADLTQCHARATPCSCVGI